MFKTWIYYSYLYTDLVEHPIRRENEVSEANLIFPEALRLDILTLQDYNDT